VGEVNVAGDDVFEREASLLEKFRLVLAEMMNLLIEFVRQSGIFDPDRT
jgi:hypothetical protein